MKRFKALISQIFTGNRTIYASVNKNNETYSGILKNVLSGKTIMYSVKFPSDVKEMEQMDLLRDFLINTTLQVEIDSIFSENNNIKLKRAFFNLIQSFENYSDSNTIKADTIIPTQKHHLFITDLHL